MVRTDHISAIWRGKLGSRRCDWRDTPEFVVGITCIHLCSPEAMSGLPYFHTSRLASCINMSTVSFCPFASEDHQEKWECGALFQTGGFVYGVYLPIYLKHFSGDVLFMRSSLCRSWDHLRRKKNSLLKTSSCWRRLHSAHQLRKSEPKSNRWA